MERTMRAGAILASALSGVAAMTPPDANSQPASDFWLVTWTTDARGRIDSVSYVDTRRIEAPAPTRRRAWHWTYNAPFAARAPGERGVTFYEYDCTARTSRLLQSAWYRADGIPDDVSAGSRPSSFVTPGTVGEGLLEFACATPSLRASRSGRWYNLRPDATPEADAARLFAASAALVPFDTNPSDK
jgi:hypothetical protein